MLASETTPEVRALQATHQRRRDVTFLAALLLLLMASAYAVVRSAYPPVRSHRTAAGMIRAVDPGVLARLLRSGHLSSHEAEHYRRVGQPAPTGAP